MVFPRRNYNNPEIHFYVAHGLDLIAEEDALRRLHLSKERINRIVAALVNEGVEPQIAKRQKLPSQQLANQLTEGHIARTDRYRGGITKYVYTNGTIVIKDALNGRTIYYFPKGEVEIHYADGTIEYGHEHEAIIDRSPGPNDTEIVHKRTFILIEKTFPPTPMQRIRNSLNDIVWESHSKLMNLFYKSPFRKIRRRK